jgi:predicted DNA-binding protein with PD1-like motif
MKIFALKKGDRVVENLTKYVDQNNLKSGLILAIGALQEAELMLYDLENKEYLSKQVNGPLEVGNFIAVIGKSPEGEAHIHPHITLANREFTTFCGHLKEAIVGATLEVIILESDQELERYKNNEIGLNLIK